MKAVAVLIIFCFVSNMTAMELSVADQEAVHLLEIVSKVSIKMGEKENLLRQIECSVKDDKIFSTKASQDLFQELLAEYNTTAHTIKNFLSDKTDVDSALLNDLHNALGALCTAHSLLEHEFKSKPAVSKPIDEILKISSAEPEYAFMDWGTKKKES